MILLAVGRTQLSTPLPLCVELGATSEGFRPHAGEGHGASSRSTDGMPGRSWPTRNTHFKNFQIHGTRVCSKRSFHVACVEIGQILDLETTLTLIWCT